MCGRGTADVPARFVSVQRLEDRWSMVKIFPKKTRIIIFWCLTLITFVT